MSDEKSEEPTGKKLRDARKKGQTAQSKDITSTVSLAAMFVYFFTAWNSIQQQFVDLVGAPALFYQQPFGSAVSGVLGLCGQVLVSVCLPIVIIPVVAGVAANFLQVGPLLAFE